MRRLLLVVPLAVVGSCRREVPPSPATPVPVTGVSDASEPPDASEGLDLRLSDGDAPAGGERVATADTTPLPDAVRDALLARLPPLPPAPREAFALRPASTPPPRPGDTVTVPFPAPSTASVPVVPSGPPKVLRHAPQGEVPVAAQVSLTFDRPMVPLGARTAVDAVVPARLDPEPPGRWRWVGTSTLLFETDGRLPMATTYTLSVPADAVDATGTKLGADFRSTFATPPLTVQAWSPGKDGVTSLAPVIAVLADQAIDASALVPSLRLAGPRGPVPLRVATPGEIDADPGARGLLRDAPAGRAAAFVPTAALDRAAPYTVTLAAGARSAEGPRPTTAPQTTSFRTFGPLRLVDTRCGWEPTCRPSRPLQLVFSQPLAPSQVLDGRVTITPALADAEVSLQGDTLVVLGDTQPRTTYMITVSDLVDAFGQHLERPASATFAVGAPEPLWPHIAQVGHDPLVPDPFAPPVVRFAVQGQGAVKVRVERVGPEAWAAYTARRQGGPGATQKVGTVILDEVRPTPGSTERQVEVAVDLSPHVEQGAGMFVVSLTSLPTEPPERRREASTWVVVTRLGVAVLADAQDTLIAVHDLTTGRAVEGATIRLGDEVLGTTDAAGLARTRSLGEGGRRPLVVNLGPDRALLSAAGGAWSWGQWAPTPSGTQLVAHVLDDRGLYRPGETVHLKGWLRHVGFDKGGDLLPLDLPPGTTVAWKATDVVGVDLAEGTLRTDAHGGFDLDLPLPTTPGLGSAQVVFTALGSSFHHGFDIREFRRPTFEVGALVETQAPHVVGDRVVVAARAAYLSGGVLPSAPVRWEVHDEPATWRPPGWEGWTFGAWEPPWLRGGWESARGGFFPRGGGAVHVWEGRTDALGTHRLAIDLRGVRPPQPRTLRAEATVQDVDRQAWTATASLLVHPASVYVGLKPSKAFYDAGEPVEVELVVVDLDGQAVPGRPVEAALVRHRARWSANGWSEDELERLPCRLTSQGDAQTCRFTPTRGGSWQLEATTTDAEGHTARSRRPVWIAGDDQVAAAEGVEQQAVTLVPDRETVEPGGSARVLAQLPFEATEALVTWQRAGVIHHERVANPGRAFTFVVEASLAHAPGLVVQVDAFGLADRPEGGPRPAYATGTLRLAVPPAPRSLTVAVEPAATAVAPGATTALTVTVTDARGQPVPGAQVVLAMVDEAVLALSGHEVLDPLATFHPERDPGTIAHHQRVQIALASARAKRGPAVEEAMNGAGFRGAKRMAAYELPAPAMMAADLGAEGASAEGDAGADAITLRSDLRPDAVWIPDARTDARGRLVVEARLPDNLTRYRVSAVAVGGDRGFGRGEADVTARLPLQLRPSPPRFLQFGDRAELPLVVQNATDGDLVVDLAVRADNLDLGARAVGLRATIPAGDRREIRVPVATVSAGRARVQAAIASGRLTDAAAFDLPVWTPATSEATAAYGVLDGPQGTVAVGQALDVPEDAWPQFGGLAIDTSSTQLQALTDAFVHLLDYPYGCTEQVGSRVLAVAALRDVLEAFDAPGLPDRAALEAAVGRDLDELVRRQNADGSFGWWRPGERGDPWLTIHAVHALVRARDARFEVRPDALARGLDALRHVDRLFDRWWSERARQVARAHALAVRQVAGEDVGREAVALYRKAGGTDGLPLEALGWLLPALHRAQAPEAAEVIAFLGNRVTETAATAQWTESYAEVDGAVLLHGSRRADAVLLDAMLQVQPTTDLLPKIVEGLLGARVKGRWSSTQEEAWVLLALQRYFRVAEAVAPDALVRAWVGPALASEHRFVGRSTERVHALVPMAALQRAAPEDLVLAREGKGRIYWRLGLTYAPRDLVLPPAEAGFSVERRYAAVDDPTDVRRDLDGTWVIRAGARVRVELSMVAPATRYHVALVDPLPAGLEVIDPALKTSGSLPEDPGGDADPFARAGWWWGPWYEHQAFRDERVESFARFVPAGVWRTTYVARATTPGSFVAPPAKAEEMYHPETFGRTSTDRVRVEP